MTTKPNGALSQMPTGVWVLGFVSLLMDISSEMIHSLLPLFMVTTLGASAFAVGLLEGLAESTALIVKVFSGVLSDYVGKRKTLALFGYALGALTKPLFAMAPNLGVVLTARLLDRFGKGVRGAPRNESDLCLFSLSVWQTGGQNEPCQTIGIGPHCIDWCRFGFGGEWALEPPVNGDCALGGSHGNDARLVGNHGGRYRARRLARHGLWLLQPDELIGHAHSQCNGGPVVGQPRLLVYFPYGCCLLSAGFGRLGIATASAGLMHLM
ncbi:MAG: MFS transporter [Candidatus Methylumidiphilus sp.]